MHSSIAAGMHIGSIQVDFQSLQPFKFNNSISFGLSTLKNETTNQIKSIAAGIDSDASQWAVEIQLAFLLQFDGTALLQLITINSNFKSSAAGMIS